jgi:ferritin-like metal-binding protein YciE
MLNRGFTTVMRAVKSRSTKREQGFFMSKLRDAFVDELKDLYDAEKQLLKALPKMAKAAENDQLRKAFEEHKAQTEEQVARLEKVFAVFDESPKGKKCKGMAGLIEEAQDLIKEEEGDAALIAAAQKAEHYEISAYGTLAAWAKALNEDEAVELLEETLEEESETDEKLSALAETVVNEQESSEAGEDEEEESEDKPSSKKKAAAGSKR